MQKRLVILLTIVGCAHQADIVVDSNASEKLVLDAITKVSLQLESFNLHYVTKLEDKFVNIMQTMNSLDAGLKQLQEKAQVWDVFRHHITAWSEHIKSSDQKIEILKKSLENLPVIENQLQNTDFKVQHVFEKSNLINEKLHEVTKSLIELRRPAVKQKPKVAQGSRSWSQEDFEQTEILMRLSKIQRILQSTCSATRVGKEMARTSSSGEGNEDESMKSLMARVNGHLEKLPIREMRQSVHLGKKNEKALETLTSVVSQIDERTIRIFDTNSYQYKKLLSCCKSAEHEVLTFANNANTLLKRTEKAIKAVEGASTVVSGEEKKNGANATEVRAQLNESDGSGASGEIDEEMLDDAGMRAQMKTRIVAK